jgi:hypothetical protein
LNFKKKEKLEKKKKKIKEIEKKIHILEFWRPKKWKNKVIFF